MAISRCSKLFYTISRCYFYIESTFSGASVSFVLSHIARYVPSPEENSCIPITYFQCKNNFEHLLSTKDFNRQVKNNIEKFEQDFMFQLSDEECEILRCKNSTSSWGGRRYNPYAFTEQGIYMLMTVLKGDLATKQSMALIRIFKQMNDYEVV